MREILFRAKRIDNGEWVEGNYVKAELIHEDGYEHYIIETMRRGKTYEIDPETLCQYTGLKDKNGNRIWENDIVSGYFNHKKITGFIKYGSNAVYYIEREGSYGIHLDNSEDWLEVIGNIFDNPELLKGE
ncbi:YopX family protein [Clostridium sp. Marseille-P3244]|uniref:YopX family protein n=1 Tax=Clostridium sp. Marseille-P3244 TaxID=1871020 RepID=UPI0009312C5A|nr:YopX family protein [Clostridium sp. Marseille-P3244]